MKILHIGPGKLKPVSDDVEPVITGIAPALSAYGLMKSQVLLGNKVGFLNSLLPPANMGIEKVEGVTFIDGICKRHRNPWYISGNWIDKIIREFGRPDIVSIHGVYNPFQNALAFRFRKMGWAYEFVSHGGLSVLAQKRHRLKKKLANVTWFKKFVSSALSVRALCEDEADSYDSYFDINRIVIAPNAVSQELLEFQGKCSEVAEGPDISTKKDLLLGFVGRVDVRHKGLDWLLKAVALYNDANLSGTQFKLFIVGPFNRNEDKDIIYGLIDELNLSDSVEIIGPLFGEQKNSQCLLCDVFCYTSRWEGLPMAVLEAMAIGKPCLVTPGTNLSDVVRRGGGWVSEPGPESICEALKLIAAEKDSIPERGRLSRRLIKDEFTWMKVAEKLNGEYMSLLRNI